MNGMPTAKAECSNKFSRASDLERLEAENQVLRAALDEAQGRIVELEMLADTDTLTPLSNRRAFLRELDKVMKNAARHGTQAALVFIDLDGLKAVNDSYGHHAGDAVLIHVARGLRGMVRATDVVARLGGDEFGLILGHLNEDAARKKAQQMIEALAAHPLQLGTVSIAVTPSWGVTMISEEESAEGALARADAAMYATKASHRCGTADYLSAK